MALALLMLASYLSTWGVAQASPAQDEVASDNAAGYEGHAMPITPANRGAVLNAAENRLTVDLPWPKHRRDDAPPQLHLKLHWSDLLATDRSNVDVRIDGTPVATRRLSSFDPNQGTVIELPPQDGGVHRLSISTRLEANGDECETDLAEAMWVHIDSGSEIRVPDAKRNSAVADFAAEARVRKQVWLAPSRAGLGRPAYVTALLAADRLVRAWGAEVRWLEEGSRAPADALVIRMRSRLDAPSQPHEMVAAYAGIQDEGYGARVVRDEEGLLILALGPEALLGAIALLGNDDALAMCNDDQCELSGSYESPEASREAETPKNSAVVLTLSDLGFAQGWSAAGRGRHQLEFLWNNDRVGEINDWPEIVIPFRLGGLEAFDTRSSQVRVLLNDQPLSSWSLQQFESGNDETLRVRIPREVWRDPAWRVRVEVDLVGQESDRCRANASSQGWFRIGRAFHLRVPADAPDDQATTRPRLLWQGGLNLAEVAGLAAITSARKERAEALEWVSSVQDCGSWCITVSRDLEVLRFYTGIHARLDGPRPTWHDAEGRFPVVSLHDSMALYVEFSEGVMLSNLVVPGQLTAPTELLSLSDRERSPWIWLDDRWRRLGKSQRDRERWEIAQIESIDEREDKREETAAPASAAASIEARFIRRFDRVWGIALMLTLGALLWGFRRRSRMALDAALTAEPA